MATLSVRIRATLDELQGLQAKVAEFGTAEDWAPALAYQVELVIEELCVNIVTHGGDGTHEIDLSMTSAPTELTIDIVDDGRAFDPFNEAPPPDLDSEVGNRPIGGLGVHFVKTMMDEAHYKRESDRNHVTLVKRHEA